jgi:D-cysteine desulfhydrase family pyridoxal phosphate-dependent enzyme
MSSLPRVSLAQLPTPLHPLERLTAQLGGPQLWIKRDDLTGFALGGNKVRKLEYLVAAAQEEGARTLITAGAVQSNHCRQTAAAAARYGFECVLVLEGDEPERTTGNLLLDGLFGSEVVWAGSADLEGALQLVHESDAAKGKRPFLIPLGGSSPLGALAYAEAMAEFLKQDVQVDRIVLATSSGGTQAGLLAGADYYGYPGKITGIRIGEYRGSERENLADLVVETAGLLGKELSMDPATIDLREDYLGPGYGVLTELERAAIETFARLEGILLDPVYTGRAAGGMLDLISRGEIGPEERVLFWHTGGTPALFAYADQLSA